MIAKSDVGAVDFEDGESRIRKNVQLAVAGDGRAQRNIFADGGADGQHAVCKPRGRQLPPRFKMLKGQRLIRPEPESERPGTQ